MVDETLQRTFEDSKVCVAGIVLFAILEIHGDRLGDSWAGETAPQGCDGLASSIPVPTKM